MALEGIRGREPEGGFGSATTDDGLDSGAGGGGRTAHHIAIRVVMVGVEESVPGEAAVKEAHTVGREEREPALRLCTLIPILEGADGTPDGQPAQDVVGRPDQALGRMAATGRHQATLRIDCLPHGLSGRQSVGRPIESEDRQAALLRLLTRRKYLLRSRDQAAEQAIQDLPGQFGSRFGQRTAGGAVLCRPLRRAKVKNAARLVATPASRPLAARERSTTIRWASGSWRRREKSWARGTVIVCTKCKNRVSKRS